MEKCETGINSLKFTNRLNACIENRYALISATL